MPNLRLGPVIVPVVTPYDGDLIPDYDAAESLASRFASLGITVFAAGTTGEMPLLMPDEKRRLVESFKKGAAGRVPVLAGSGWPNPYMVLEEARILAGAGADAILVPPPYYYPVPQYSLVGFYQWIARSIEVPVLIYTIPSHTGVEVSVETIAALSREDGIIGVKATVPDILFQARLIRQVKEENPSFHVYSGLDALLLLNLSLGGDGGVVAGCNLTPKLHVELVEEWRSGNVRRAERLNRLINKISWVLEPARSIQGGIKTILSHEGLIPTDNVRPPLPPEDEASRRLVLERWRESGLRDYL